MLEFFLFLLLSKDSVVPLSTDPAPQNSAQLLEVSAIPQKKSTRVSPKMLEDPRTALLAIDLGSGKTLLSKEINRPQNIASLTKLMTALIILEEHDMNEIVTVSGEAARTEGAQIDLYEYEQLTVRTLLEAILIPSANDAAKALAIHNAGSEAAFVEKMNAKAKSWGFTTAEFYNSTGLDIYPKKDETGGPKGNVLSAAELSLLAQKAWKNKFIRTTVGKTSFSGSSVDEKFYHEKETTNELLESFLNIKGLKTGYTLLAGQCFIAIGENQQGNEVMTIVLGSEDRFGETKNLISWIYDAFEW